MKCKIAAVVVTYNRLTLLQECVASLRNQTHKLDEIIVVNNSSTDGTLEWLSSQQDLTTITQENSGGAGGFYTGIKTANEKGYDWIWCLDQDIETNHNTLLNLINSKVAKHKDIGFLTSLAFFNENEISYTNVPLLPPSHEIIRSLAIDGELPILCSSFGSVLISRHAISEAGLPIQNFFIWGDDSEYTIRMIELGFKGFLIMNSTVYHKSAINDPDPFLTIDPRNIRAKIGIRNKIYLIKLRNKLLYNSSLRGFLASLNYIMKIAKQRLKKPTGRLLIDLLLFFKYFLQGLFYNPRKYLELEIYKKMKNKFF